MASAPLSRASGKVDGAKLVSCLEVVECGVFMVFFFLLSFQI